MTPTPDQIETRAIQIQARTYRGPFDSLADDVKDAARWLARAELEREFEVFRAGWIAGVCGSGKLFTEAMIEADWHRIASENDADAMRHLVEEPADG